MIVEDLIRYFNAADGQHESLLYPRGERVEAWHHGLRLASRFEPIADLQRERIVGHRAALLAERADGTPVSVADAYALCESEPAVVHFDRLCRTLHALNFLAQRRTVGGYLQLAVHPRHLQAVPSQHGLVYEAILKRCGLAPEDIVLEFAVDGALTANFTRALASYRERGYRLALRIPAGEAATWAALRPDILCCESAEPGAVAGSLRQQAGIDDGEAFRQALANGVELATGALFGEPAAACRATHNPEIKSYNPPSTQGVSP